MLPKKNRADTKAVEKIFKNSSVLSSPHFTFRFLIAGGERQISFIAPKSVSKGAVERNYLRRLGYSALKKHLSASPAGITGVFIFKKYQDDISILENEIKNILGKIN